MKETINNFSFEMLIKTTLRVNDTPGPHFQRKRFWAKYHMDLNANVPIKVLKIEILFQQRQLL